MRHLRLILSDFQGLIRVCGWGVAIRWLWAIVTHFQQCKKRGNLAPVDLVFGDGPLAVYRGGKRAMIAGPCVMTGIRELWVRDSYFRPGLIQLKAGDVVVDLGAATGGFTTQALLVDPTIRVIAVETDTNRCRRMQQMMDLNGLSPRVRIINAFVGNGSPQPIAGNGVPTLSDRQLVDQLGLSQIDVLKCDIEGSEFDLISQGSPLLAITRQLCAELHPHAGDVNALVASIQKQGFVTVMRQQHTTYLLFARRG